jgi:hypothetical protein
MDSKPETNSNLPGSEDYLKNVECEVNPRSGLYEPNSATKKEQKIDVTVHAKADDPVIRAERPRGSFEDAVANALSTASLVVAGISVLLSIFTLVGLVAAAYIAKGQWDEMRKATKASTDAANTAACALKENQRQFNITSATNTAQFQKTLSQIIRQTKAQGEAAVASKTSASIAQAALENGERPWLAVTAKVTKFNWEQKTPGNMTLNFGYQITVENVGNLPALKVYVVPDKTLLPPMSPEKFIEGEQDKFCADSIEKDDFTRQTGTNAVTISPHQTYTFREIGESTTQSETQWKNTSTVVRYIRGCVVYRSPTHKIPRQSGFIYALQRKGWMGSIDARYKDAFEQIDLYDASGEVTSN